MEIPTEEVIAYLKKMNYSEEKIKNFIENPIMLKSVQEFVKLYKEGIAQLNPYADPYETISNPEKINEAGKLSGRKF